MQTSVKKTRVNEVSFSNQIHEFINFYNKHRNICNEISGIKKRLYYTDGKEVSIAITRLNFDKAIKGLWSFAVNNLHYIVDKSESKNILFEVNKLESDFNNDEEYYKLRKKEEEEEHLEPSNLAEFNILYFDYIIRCFELTGRLNRSLQKSMMISTVEVKKAIQYQDVNSFYENLSKFREEISNDLADFELKTIVDHLKRIMGYFFSYKMMIGVRESKFIESLIKKLVEYIFKKDVIKLVASSKNIKDLPSGKKIEIADITIRVKNILMRIYVLINESLSDKNILPKLAKNKYIDMTLI